jgi:plasmid maintenance system antidote protein VapI
MIDESKEEITKRFLEAESYVTETYQLKKQSAFADTIGVSNQHGSNIKSGRSNVNAWMIASLVKHYREIDPDYLLNGNGSLLRPTKQEQKTLKVMEKYNESLQAEVAFLRKEVEYLRSLIPTT